MTKNIINKKKSVTRVIEPCLNCRIKKKKITKYKIKQFLNKILESEKKQK